jgi:hypothetical protein
VECCEAAKPNGDSICQLGAECGNRLFQKKEYAKVERFQEFEMGWGLRSAAPMVEGELVIEYIGEVIDEQMMQTRMGDQRKYTPNDHNFYIMQLDTGLYVDGKYSLFSTFHLFTLSFAHVLTHLLMQSLTHPCTCSCTHSLAHSLTLSYNCSLTHSLSLQPE